MRLLKKKKKKASASVPTQSHLAAHARRSHVNGSPKYSWMLSVRSKFHSSLSLRSRWHEHFQMFIPVCTANSKIASWWRGEVARNVWDLQTLNAINSFEYPRGLCGSDCRQRAFLLWRKLLWRWLHCLWFYDCKMQTRSWANARKKNDNAS